jgi:hypothetical protein
MERFRRTRGTTWCSVRGEYVSEADGESTVAVKRPTQAPSSTRLYIHSLHLHACEPFLAAILEHFFGSYRSARLRVGSRESGTKNKRDRADRKNRFQISITLLSRASTVLIPVPNRRDGRPRPKMTVSSSIIKPMEPGVFAEVMHWLDSVGPPDLACGIVPCCPFCLVAWTALRVRLVEE